MHDRRLERNALLLLWSTLRNHLQPELTSPLARDKAKRSDAALLRLIAGYDHLAALRTRFEPGYAALLAEARGLAGDPAAVAEAVAASSEDENPVFIGVPGLAGQIEAFLTAAAGRAQGLPRDARFDDFLARLASLEASMRGEFEALAVGIRPVVERAAQPVTPETLQRYLRAHPHGNGRLVVRTVVDIPGGRSKRTVLAGLEGQGKLPAEIVLRMDTGRGVGTNVAEEFPLLSRVASRGLPVPEPLWLESSTEPYGFPFIVFRRMPGASAGDLMEGAFNKVPATGRALARILATIHAAGSGLIEDPAMRGSAVPHTVALLDHYYDWWTEKKPFPSLVIEAAFAWMRRHTGRVPGQATVVHADTAFHNLLLDDQGNGCLLDWEFAHLGDGAEDLASCRPAVEKFMPWPDFMREYQAHGGLPVEDFQLDYFEIWRPLRNAVVCGSVLDSLLRGEADDIDPVTISLSTFARLQADLARSLASVTGRAQLP